MASPANLGDSANSLVACESGVVTSASGGVDDDDDDGDGDVGGFNSRCTTLFNASSNI